MSYFDKKQFEYEFALRTAYNLKHIEKEVERNKKEGTSEEEYHLYEVTQLINSFIGLITLPKERYFSNLSDNIHFDKGSEAESVLRCINEDDDRFIDTYLIPVSDGANILRKKTKEEKRLNEKQLLLRLRNAASHGRFSVYPEKPGEGKEIKELRFGDSCTVLGYWKDLNRFVKSGNRDKYFQQFSIVLSVSEIRVLAISLCKLIVLNYSEVGGVWPQELDC